MTLGVTGSLFDEAPGQAAGAAADAPLAARMRPRTLDELVGQEAVVGPGSPLRALIDDDRLSSVILWGPAGTGKTSLAGIIAAASSAAYVELSAVSAGVADVRRAIAGAEELKRGTGRRTLLFIDEIHRFNKNQQDSLLKAVESGVITMIGATTENPFFEVNSPLLSRSLLFRLEALGPDDVTTLLRRAVADPRGLDAQLEVEADALAHIVDRAGGDARFALNALEMCASIVVNAGRAEVTVEDAQAALRQPVLRYDKAGDVHYDVISAFIKSMRGSDPDAAVFWLAQMLESGEDPEFIARRMVIFASEDIGNADAQALVVAVAAFDALRVVGLPEASLNLSQAALYLAVAPKSNASMMALSRAREELNRHGAQAVPGHLRDAHYPAARRLAHGDGYQYPHDFDGGWVAQQYLPDRLRGARFYEPVDRGREKAIRERLQQLRGEPGAR
ncbi:MAG: putative ATPase [Chloroflexota bacterium]|jgi:putative ATPase|nr:putative ATPase [Chloroflexota bacterium]